MSNFLKSLQDFFAPSSAPTGASTTFTSSPSPNKHLLRTAVCLGTKNSGHELYVKRFTEDVQQQQKFEMTLCFVSHIIHDVQFHNFFLPNELKNFQELDSKVLQYAASRSYTVVYIGPMDDLTVIDKHLATLNKHCTNIHIVSRFQSVNASSFPSSATAKQPYVFHDSHASLFSAIAQSPIPGNEKQTSTSSQEEEEEGQVEKTRVFFDDYPEAAISDEELLDQFQKCTLALEKWTHFTRIRVVYLYLQQHGFKETFHKDSKLCQDWKQFKTSVGHGEKFHVTLTLCFVKLVEHYKQQFVASIPKCNHCFHDFYSSSYEIATGSAWKTYYSEELMLRNEKSRSEWIEPDLKKLP